MLDQYGDNIWAIRTPLLMMGMDISTQMTIVRLPDQSLVLISPVAISDGLKGEIEALGTVAIIVSPNTFHHLFAQQCLDSFPGAIYLSPAALQQRIKALPPSTDLYNAGEDIWQGQLQTRRISQSHMADEMVFFHPESKTLIVTDCIQYSDGDLGLGSKLFAMAAGTLRKPAISRLYKAMIKDKQELRDSLEYILGWDFERVLVPHNTNIEVDAKDTMTKIAEGF